LRSSDRHSTTFPTYLKTAKFRQRRLCPSFQNLKFLRSFPKMRLFNHKVCILQRQLFDTLPRTQNLGVSTTTSLMITSRNFLRGKFAARAVVYRKIATFCRPLLPPTFLNPRRGCRGETAQIFSCGIQSRNFPFLSIG